MNTYIHKTDHRLRIRSDYIRRHPAEVEALLADLRKIDAIQTIKHQRYAGSVAVTFDSTELTCEALLEILSSHNWTSGPSRPTIIEDAVATGVKSLSRGMALIALKRLLNPIMPLGL